ncbi:MAG: hypothetical protein H6869_09040 [Rhodospirillales bacterium]|nr:hypothetical protein [Rhodospirillales bacterium]
MMKKYFRPLLLLAAVAVFAVPALASDYTTESPPAFLIDGEPLDPICFLNDWSGIGPEDSGDGVSFYPVANCRIGEIVVDPVDPEANPAYVGASYAEDFYDDEADEVYTTRGYVAYRYIGETNGRHAFIVVENGGGSGTFSTIALYEPGTHPVGDTPVTMLKKVRTFGGGDRCNGGVVDGAADQDGLRYSLSVTPYDMLGLTGDPERAILQSPAAEQVISCAACCYGTAHFSQDRFTGLTLNKENLPHLDPDAEGVMGCVDNLVKLNIEHGTGTFDAEGAADFIREIEHSCLGRMEGE